MTALTVSAAARVLGVPPGTLRRWIRQGCPTVDRGQKGRGHACLVDVEAVLAWRRASRSDALILELAGELPNVLAAASLQAFTQIAGNDKPRMAGVLAGTWYLMASATLDYLRAKCPEVPEISSIPPEVGRLQKIAR